MKHIILFEDFINEISSSMASKAFTSGRNDERTNNLKKDVITHLFKDYIGRNLSFYVKTRKDNTPTKYTLIEVTFGADKILNLYFNADNDGDIDDSPFVNKKKDFVMNYSLDKDEYINESALYNFNAYTTNFLIKAANIIRQTYFNAHPVRIDGVVSEEETNKKKISRLSKTNFAMFSYDSDNLMNN